MNTLKAESLNKFRRIFEEQKNQILERAAQAQDQIRISADDMSDEVDLTAASLESNMQIRLRHREALLLKKIDEALEKIQAGTFGDCESCGEEIGWRRLEARPTASLCIHCKEEEERREFSFSETRKPKSIGTALRLLA